jgi:hypothetical protein
MTPPDQGLDALRDCQKLLADPPPELVEELLYVLTETLPAILLRHRKRQARQQRLGGEIDVVLDRLKAGHAEISVIHDRVKAERVAT